MNCQLLKPGVGYMMNPALSFLFLHVFEIFLIKVRRKRLKENIGISQSVNKKKNFAEHELGSGAVRRYHTVTRRSLVSRGRQQLRFKK